MSNQRYSPEFKEEAVRQVIQRGYSVREVASRVGVSAHSRYKWVRAARHTAAGRTWYHERGDRLLPPL